MNAILDLSMNTPPPPDGMDFDDMLKQGLSQVLMRADNALLMTYHMVGGSESDLTAGAKWLAPMFGHLDSQQLVVCPGAQTAIAALILVLTQPGDVILVEQMTYPACAPQRPNSAGTSLPWTQTHRSIADGAE